MPADLIMFQQPFATSDQFAASLSGGFVLALYIGI